MYSDGPDRALFRTETANAPVGGTENETPLAYSIFYRIIYYHFGELSIAIRDISFQVMNTLHRFCPAQSVDNPNQNHQKPMSQAVRTTGSEAGISQPIESQPIKNKTDTDSYRLMTEAIDSIRQAEEAVERLARFRLQQKMSNNRAKSVVRELKELEKVLSLYIS